MRQIFLETMLKDVKAEHILDHLDDGILLLDADAKILWYNQGLIQLIGGKPATEKVYFQDLVYKFTREELNLETPIVQWHWQRFQENREKITMNLIFAKEDGDGIGVNVSIKKITHNQFLARVCRDETEVLNHLRKSGKEVYEIPNSLTVAELMALKLANGLKDRLSTDDLFLARIALRELLVNAVEHGNLGITFDEKTRFNVRNSYEDLIRARQGNENNRRKKVVIEVSYKKNRARFVIRDMGKGFDFKGMLNRSLSSEENRWLNHGRGILLAKRLFKKLKYKPPGNIAILEI